MRINVLLGRKKDGSFEVIASGPSVRDAMSKNKCNPEYSQLLRVNEVSKIVKVSKMIKEKKASLTTEAAEKEAAEASRQSKKK
jgi:hypothetical protein